MDLSLSWAIASLISLLAMAVWMVLFIRERRRNFILIHQKEYLLKRCDRLYDRTKSLQEDFEKARAEMCDNCWRAKQLEDLLKKGATLK